MVKQRTPRGQRPGRRGPVRPDAPIARETPAPEAPVVLPAAGESEPSLHESLLETVSPESLQMHPAEAPAETDSVAEPEIADEPVDEAAEFGPAEHEAYAAAPLSPASEEPETAPPAEAAVPEAGPVTETEPAAAAAEGARPEIEPLAAAAEAVRALGPQLRVRLSTESLDIGGINDTLIAYMRNESAAALAHLQALSRAKSPADLIRMQVGELQRVADASLTCWVDVARRAGRIVEIRRT